MNTRIAGPGEVGRSRRALVSVGHLPGRMPGGAPSTNLSLPGPAPDHRPSPGTGPACRSLVARVGARSSNGRCVHACVACSMLARGLAVEATELPREMACVEVAGPSSNRGDRQRAVYELAASLGDPPPCITRE